MLCRSSCFGLRGLRWVNVDLDRRTLHVRERADRYNQNGKPKSEAGERAVPLLPMVVNMLREWRLTCPRKETSRLDESGNSVRELDLVFPNGPGNVESLANIINRGLLPVQTRAGVLVDKGVVDEVGKPVLSPKYTGLYALRHFYAS